MTARVSLSHNIPKESSLYEIYLAHLLDAVVSTSGSTSKDSNGVSTTSHVADEIGQVLRPLAILVSSNPEHDVEWEDGENIRSLSKDAWFNLIAHDFTLRSPFAAQHMDDLRTLAWYSPVSD